MNLEKVYFKAKDENYLRLIINTISLSGVKTQGWMNKDSYGRFSYPFTIMVDFSGFRVWGAETLGAESYTQDRTLATTADLVAYALVGFKEPWEVAPIGYRLVTDEERTECNNTDRDYTNSYCWINKISKNCRWNETMGHFGGEWTLDMDFAYAIPTSCTFEKPVKKMTVAEIAKKLGYDVEIVK